MSDEKLAPYTGRRKSSPAKAVQNLTSGGGSSQGGKVPRCHPGSTSLISGGSASPHGSRLSFDVVKVPGMGYVPSVKRQPSSEAADPSQEGDPETHQSKKKGGEKR